MTSDQTRRMELKVIRREAAKEARKRPPLSPERAARVAALLSLSLTKEAGR